MTDQLLQDLHALLGEVDVGWEAVNTSYRYGVGGCLLNEMGRSLPRGSRSNFFDRRLGMVLALGFSALEEMYAWNDAQTDPDAIKRRIKDAIEGLGS